MKIIFRSLSLLGEQYIQECELSSGKNSRVYLVRDQSTQTRYIYREFTGSSDAYEALQNHNCPHLPKILQVSHQAGQVAVLEEYIPGDNLDFLLEGGPLPAEQARNIARQVCLGLEALHARGVVHRDVKPENILLLGDKAVLIDFDASRTYKEALSSDTRVMGTTGYAAPEQFGFSQTDARADIYSVGVLINEMLTRNHPSVLLAQGPLRPVIERCIEVNVDKRYASTSELLAALAAPAPRKQRPWRWILPTAALLLGTALLPFLPSEEPQALVIQGSGEPTTPTPIPDAFFTDTSVAPWTGIAESSYTEFEYDLDGDGTPETYYFLVGSDLPGLSLGGSDMRTVPPGMTSELVIAPVVVELDEQGQCTYALEFRDLLKNSSVILYCAQQWGNSTPSLGSYGYLNGIWPGATLIQFEAEDTGIWVYELTAELDGETLTARGVSHILAPDTTASQITTR